MRLATQISWPCFRSNFNRSDRLSDGFGLRGECADPTALGCLCHIGDAFGEWGWDHGHNRARCGYLRFLKRCGGADRSRLCRLLNGFRWGGVDRLGVCRSFIAWLCHYRSWGRCRRGQGLCNWHGCLSWFGHGCGRDQNINGSRGLLNGPGNGYRGLYFLRAGGFATSMSQLV